MRRCNGVRVNFIARARTAAAIKDERMHGRARILGDQWRRVRTRDMGRKEVSYVCGQICARTRTGRRTTYENVAATAPATAATLRFSLFMPDKIFHASRREGFR